MIWNVWSDGQTATNRHRITISNQAPSPPRHTKHWTLFPPMAVAQNSASPAMKMEAGLRVCPRCGKPLHMSATVCRSCGEPVAKR